MKNRIPLLFKLLIPLVVLESVLLLLLIALFHHEQTNWMHQTARQRAELLAQALEQRAQTTTTPETLSRAAENFATNRDVMEIYVLSLPQGTIHASSQPSAVHQSFESITTQAPLISGSGQIHQPRLHVQGHILWYAMPTLLPNWQGGTRGMEGLIVIELDLTSAIAMLWSPGI